MTVGHNGKSRYYVEQSSRGKIEGFAFAVGEDLLVAMWGGQGHVGAVAIAIPLTSASGKVDAYTSVYTATGHKEEELAREAAAKISRELNRKVVVTAGINFHRITAGEIEEILLCAGRITDGIISEHRVLRRLDDKYI